MENPFERYSLSDLVGRRTLKWQAYPADVLPLWVAEMDTDLAEPVRDAVIAAARSGAVGYPWGRAYPDALAGEHIPLLSRILGVVDAYEAMTSDRPYRRALPQDEAIARLRAAAGTQFDPAIVAVFLRAVWKVSPASPERTPLPLRPNLHKHPA